MPNCSVQWRPCKERTEMQTVLYLQRERRLQLYPFLATYNNKTPGNILLEQSMRLFFLPKAVVRMCECHIKSVTIKLHPIGYQQWQYTYYSYKITQKRQTHPLVWLIKSDYVSLNPACPGQIRVTRHFLSVSLTRLNSCIHTCCTSQPIYSRWHTFVKKVYLFFDWLLTHDSHLTNVGVFFVVFFTM